MRPSDERGFTLIEVMVATMILTVALVSLAELMAITLRMQMLGRNETSATRLAQDKLDELMSKNFDTAADIQIGGSLDNDVTNYNDLPAENPNFKRRWVVTAGPVDPAPTVSANLRMVTVRVFPVAVNDRTTMPPVELVSIIRRW